MLAETPVGPTVRTAMQGRPAGGARTVGQAMAQVAPAPVKPTVTDERTATQVVADEENNGADPAPNEKDPTETRYERSRRAFLRAGWKEDEFRKLDRQEAIRRGIKLERKQNRQAEEFAKAKTEASKKGESSQAQSAGETQSRVATPPDESLLAELFTSIGIADDPEAQAALRAKLSPVLSERAQLKRDLEQRSREAEGSDANQLARVERARTRVAETIPELADDDDFKSHVAPVIAALAATPRFAAASTDDAVLEDLIATATRLALEEVGESAGPTSEHGAPGRGFMDMGARGPRGITSVEPKDVFMATVHDEIAKMQRAS